MKSLRKHTPKTLRQSAQAGFTILELMIATVILTVILLIVTSVITGVGNLYYKGISQSQLQDSVRSLVDELSQKIQISGGSGISYGSDANGANSICIQGTRYTYVLHTELGASFAHQTLQHVIWRDQPSSAQCTPVDLTATTPSANGTDLSLSKTRLVNLSIQDVGSALSSGQQIYDITVREAYGDDDQLCSPSVANDCTSTGTSSSLNNTDLICKSVQGDSFCATAGFSTTVIQRLID